MQADTIILYNKALQATQQSCAPERSVRRTRGVTVLDPDQIWPKLERVGEDEVRKRLAAGLYANRKVPVIEEWLRRKDVERDAPTYMYHAEKAPQGQVFTASDVPALEKTGWVDSPQKFGTGLRPRARRMARILHDFWLAHWKWLLGTGIAVALGMASLLSK